MNNQILPKIVTEQLWQEALERTHFVFLDGPSSSGKSSIKSALVADQALGLEFAPRYTTRSERPGDAESGDYYFVTHAKFEEFIRTGEMVEYRKFMFGMAYGSGKSSLAKAASSSRRVLSLMNIGNARAVKKILKNCICVYIDVPTDMIERRIRARGLNTEEQIAERLANVAEARKHIQDYDLIIENLDGEFDSTYRSIAAGLQKYWAI